MDFRLVDEKDKAAVKWLWGYCFENYEPFYSWYFDQYYQTKNTLGAYHNDKLVSCLQLIPYEIAIRGKTIPTSYIVGVASFPESRKGGIVRKLLSKALKEMQDRGQFVSILMPFKAGFYYPYQWELCYHHLKYSLPLDALGPAIESYGEIRQGEVTDIKDFAKIYDVFTAKFHGYVVRSEQNWSMLFQDHFGEKGHAYLLYKDDQPEGYILYYLRDNKFLVREMAYSNSNAQKSLLQFAYSHRSHCKNFEWLAPINDYIHYLLADPKDCVSLYPFMAARIVDFPVALESFNYSSEINANFTIQIQDELAEWNNQTFSVTIHKGQAKVLISSKEPEIIVDIGVFTQILFGRLSAKELANNGRVTVVNPHALEILEELFPTCINYINEYY